MRIELPHSFERLGAARVYDIQRVYELDGGLELDNAFSNPFHVIQQIPGKVLNDIEKNMAIVLPVKNERLRLLEGVMTGVPHSCLPIIVSNSDLNPTNRFDMECDMLQNFCRSAKKRYIVAHQKDPDLAKMFLNTPLENILGDDGLIRSGKAEGMILATVLAALAGKRYVGFVDSDNFFPGSVFEYVRLFSAGLALANTPYSMIRIHWHSKPKIVGSELFFAKWGRVSRVTNQFLNQLLSIHTGFETEIIKTANAGEHALSMDLALNIGYSSGFSIETNHFISVIEKYGGILPYPAKEALQKGVSIYQMESRNPHLHESGKGDDHISEMLHDSLSIIYHSKACPAELKRDIISNLRKFRILKHNEIPEEPRKYEPLSCLDKESISAKLRWNELGNFRHDE